jgi:CDP-4-dehydro-6-deoxyglucose reductase/3-phenylpropionate/trans-cinnamate dioxygenase ferredoxin reductase subunit
MSAEITVGDSDVTFPCQDGQTVLDAAETTGWSIPYSCRKGVCTTCVGGLTRGEVALPGRGAVPAPADDVLLCQAVPAGPVQIAPRWIRASAPPRRKTVRATVYRLHRPVPRVTVLELRFPIGLRAPFRAGQYLRVLLDDGDSRLYSMANSPQHNDSAQLHVRTEPGGRFSDYVVRGLKRGDQVTVELPFGEFVLDLDDPPRPIVMIATGTGFAPLKSMIEHKIVVWDRRPVHLYWGARVPEDLYLADLARHWERRHGWFRFTPVVSRPSPTWTGATGWVQHAVLADHPDLREHDVYACGSEAMIAGARTELTARAELTDERFHADTFLPSAAPSAVAEPALQEVR